MRDENTSHPLRRILVLTGDHQLAEPSKWDGAYGEYDLRLHDAMLEAFRSLGRFEVGVCTDHEELLHVVTSERPELVVNFCDTGFRNRADMELNVPALLEVLDVPYTGAPPGAMALAYDKGIVGMLASSLGIPTPVERILGPGLQLGGELAAGVAFPAFVKPAQGDGSVGITRGALVDSEDALVAQVAEVRRLCPGDVLVQEYLPGPEYGLALLGNGSSLSPLPMLEVDFSRLPDGLPPILAFESKTGPATPYDDVGIRPATLPAAAVDGLVGHARRLFCRIGCRDYARFDFRTARDGEIKLMEVNPNPAWSEEAKLAKMAAFGGMPYPRLLECIVDAAWARVEQAR